MGNSCMAAVDARDAQRSATTRRRTARVMTAASAVAEVTHAASIGEEMFCLKGRFFLGGGDSREPRRDTLSRAYPATMESNKRARTTEGETLASNEIIQSLRDQMAKRKAEQLAVETELATLRAELRRALSETREGDVQSTITNLRGGAITVFEVIAEQLPDVFAAEILSKLDLFDTLSLAQVSKRYNEVVWNVAAVRSLEAKIEAQLRIAVGLVGYSSSPMLWAAKYGNLPAIRAILQSGVDVNKKHGTKNWTGLHVAAGYDQVDAVKLLLEAGADPNIRDEDGKYRETALLMHLINEREFGDNPLLVRALIQAGADVKTTDKRLDTPLHYTENEACAMMLIEAGADINALNGHGRSPLRTAIRFKRPAVERLLRRFKALDIGP